MQCKLIFFIGSFLLGSYLQGSAQMRKVIRNAAGFVNTNPSAISLTNNPSSCSVDTILITSQAQIDNFSTTYPTCTNPKYLLINGFGASPAITNLNGLASVTQVIKKLKITNTSIVNLSALTALTQIGDTLQLENNLLLTSIGLNNLTQLGGLYLKSLPVLTSLAGLSNQISSIGNVRIDSALALSNLSGLSNITKFTGNLEILHTPIVNLSVLNNTDTIQGWLWLENDTLMTSIGLTNLKICYYFLFGNLTHLTSMAGLTTNIINTNTGTFWVNNTALTNLNGLEGLTGAPNFYISGNQQLVSLQGLQNLTGDIIGGISLYYNPVLTNINALTNINNISDGTLELGYNYNLSNLTGLNHITTIGKGLWIYGNNALTSLNFLDSNLVIQNNGNTDSVQIYDNPVLSACSFPPLCSYLSNSGTSSIYNNASGCNNTTEIQSFCTNNYLDIEDNCCTYNAIPINRLESKSGNVNRFIGLDGNGDPVYDDYDTYRIILPHDGAFQLYVNAINDSCGNSSDFGVDILDKYGNYILGNTLLDWSSADPCNLIKSSSFKFRAFDKDTFFLSFHGSNGNSNRYSFYYDLFDSTGSDIEPNGNVGTAIPIALNQVKKGHVSFRPIYDQDDYYKTTVPNASNLKVFVKATFRGDSWSTQSYNQLNFVCINNSFVRSIPSNILIPNLDADSVYTDTFRICAVGPGDVYFKMTSQSPYEYEFSYEITDTLPPDIEPNDNFTTATVIAENETKSSTLKKATIGVGMDNDDYFQTVLPKNGTVKIIVQATNSLCSNGNMQLLAYNYKKNTTGGLVLLRYVGNNSNVAPGAIVFDTIYICGQAADSFYIRYTSSTPFVYSFRYEMVDSAFTDAEPNNTFTQAIPTDTMQVKNGSLNFISNRTTTDSYDYYRIIMPVDGNIKLMVQSTNISCNNGWMFLSAYDYRKSSGFLFNRYLPATTNLPYGATAFDTILFCGRAANDTIYIRLEASSPFNYTWKYEIQDTSSNDAEPNGTFTNAIPLSILENKKGNIRYTANGVIDQYDYYKTLLPTDGTLKIMVQATNNSCANGQWIYMRAYDQRQAAGNIYSTYINNNTNVAAGQTIYDTIYLCGRAADSFYLRFEASAAFSYQVKYDISDTSSNDIEPNGTFSSALGIVPGETKRGHIRYAANGTYDAYDYYKTLLPTDGTIKIMVAATNTSCINGQWIYMSTFDRRQASGNVSNQYINNNTAVLAGQTIYDTIYLCGRAADSFYLRFESSAPFIYTVKYEMIDSSTNDIEPNNSFAEATLFGGAQIKKGHIRYYANGTYDVNDYYKIVFTNSDSLKLQLQAINRSCINGQWIYFTGYNKNFSPIFARYMANNTSVAAGQTITDSIKIFVNAPDTIYLKFESSNSFQYQFSSNPLIPSSAFSIVGDSSSCFGTKTYKAINIVDNNVTYNWSISGGGTISFTDSIANVNWTTNGTHTISLYLSNLLGNSSTKVRSIIVNNNAPTEIPFVVNASRTLITGLLPSGTFCQWYKNNILIPGATDSLYYAADSGSYTVKYVRPCGFGPSSNSIYFPAAALSQTITFLHTPNIIMSPTAKAKLNASSSSGLPVSYQLISGNAIVLNDTVYVNSAGTVIVKALQQGSDIFLQALPKYDTITVVQGPQSIIFNAIPGQVYTTVPMPLLATASSGLPITYTILSGNAIISGSNLILTGAGNITVRANQPGNSSYSAATPIQQSFCVGVRTLSSISGSVSPCLATYTYRTQKIPDANYTWTLSGGGILTTNMDTAFVQWQTPGTYTLKVKANSGCDPVFSNEVEYTIATSNTAPDPVNTMLPANNSINLQLPIVLSWIPGNNTVNYDLFVWDSAQAQPVTPFASNINAVSFTLPNGSLTYNKTYKWRIISKNPCIQTVGPVQQFSLIPLPDLVTQNVQAPTTAFSGQSISISWTVKNQGPGKTTTNQSWKDGVFLTFDSMPNFSLAPQTDPALWGSLDFPSRPLLIASKQNVTALDSGQQYTNSVNFTLPVSYSLPLYVYVIANYPNSNTAPLQVTKVNDTARAPLPIAITLSPTPDLRVDTVFTPTTTFSGSTINLTYKVKNYGVLTPAGVSWRDKVYVSQSPIFNINTAIPVQLPKANGTYYANTNPAEVTVNNQLLADGVYTRSFPIVIPNYIFGTYFIYVHTNFSNTLYEGALSNNNQNRAQAQVFLTPTPRLTVSSLNVPVTIASTTQPIGVSWNIRNTGINDNMEKNKGHYFVQNGACNFQPSNLPGLSFRDSVGFGGSYWVDRVYLSTDSNALNTNTAILVNTAPIGVLNSGLNIEDNFTNPASTCQVFGTNGATYNVNTANVIQPNSNHPNSNSFTIPSNLIPGDYYVYVLANATKTVYEYPGTPETRRSTLPITIQRPDVVVSAVNIPATATGGQPITINYSILNNGPGAIFNHTRRDLIYVSNSPVFNGSAQLIQTLQYTENIPVGTPVVHQVNYTFPIATSGNRYIFIHTNFDSAFKENNTANNISAAALTLVSPGAPNDLVVSSIQLADTVYTAYSTYFKYTVQNNGTGTTAGAWVDSIFISCSPTFNRSTSFYLTYRNHNKNVGPGNQYSDSFSLSIPFAYFINSCFPKQVLTNAYFFIKTNANNGIYEGTNGNNNLTGTGNRVLINPSVDHIVTAVTAADTATVARPYSVNWTVKNIGYNPGINHYSLWYEGIYFSTDSVFNNNVVFATPTLVYTPLNTNQVYNQTINAIPPNLPTGDYYVFVGTNISPNAGIAHEVDLNNNYNLIRNGAGAAKKIHLIQPLLPDLTDSIVSAPTIIAVGQPLTFVHKVKNNGLGITYPNSWSNDLWLSNDLIPGNFGDIQLSGNNHVGALLPGQSYLDTINMNIAINQLPGNYVLISRVNSTENVFETNKNNNLAFQYITVYSPAPSDLIVESILKPDTVLLGYTLDSAKWVVRNIAANTASGISSDGIYLSKNNFLDSTAVLLGIRNKVINMGPLARDTISLSPLVNNVTEGNYQLIVKTDLLNNIVESDKNNNIGIASTPIYVKVKELPLNVLTPNTLFTTNRIYKLIIPDSLNGATILVTLKSNDSLTMKNQLYIGKEYIPSAANFDYAFNTPNYGNQDIVMTTVTTGTYYITVRCVSANPVVQNITLKAIKLPFSILTVQTGSGGNTGNVTIKISGSLFSNNMTAKLTKTGTTINASAVYFTNSTIVYATFNLQGKPLGIYNVTLTKPDTTIATLVNGFSVVNANNGGLITGGGINTGPGNGNEPGCAPGAASGLNSQLVTEIVAPERVLVGWPFVIQINYTNPTNVDIPAQARTLYSDHDVLMSRTPDGVANGTTSLYLELTEQNGPPGIIRAGGSGSILIYSKMYATIPRNTVVLFKLK